MRMKTQLKIVPIDDPERREFRRQMNASVEAYQKYLREMDELHHEPLDPGPFHTVMDEAAAKGVTDKEELMDMYHKMEREMEAMRKQRREMAMAELSKRAMEAKAKASQSPG